MENKRYCPECKKDTEQIIVLYNPDDWDSPEIYACTVCGEHADFVIPGEINKTDLVGEPLKGSTEEPLTPIGNNVDLNKIREKVNKLLEVETEETLLEWYTNFLRKNPKEQLSAPLEPLHETALPTDEEIDDAWSKMINVSKSVGFVNGAKWMREKLRSRLLPSNPESPSNEWIPVSTPPDEGEEVLGYSEKWIHPDFNPKGIRVCYLNDGEWVSAKWDNDQDSWHTHAKWCCEENGGKDFDPSHWMPLPSPPTTKD